MREEIVPHVDEWEEAREFPRELYTRAGELGFLGLKYPEELGGQGGDYVHDAVWAEELAAAGASGGRRRRARRPHRDRDSAGLRLRHARPARALPAAGDPRASESPRWGSPSPGAGSDVASIRTRAERVDGGWVVNGSKTFITNGVRADFLVCAVKTTAEGGHGGISFLILEREMAGYEVTRKLEKMGWHSSDTGELAFTDVEVPDENLLGEEDRGFYLIMSNFAWERLLMSLGAVGGMRRLLDAAISYSLERNAFGRPIGHFQTIRHKVAEMAIKLEQSRAMTYMALRRFVAGEDVIRDVAMTKLLTQRALLEVADECLQIHGGYGYMREYGIERAVRDARLGPIGGGTDEVMKEILGKQLGL